MTKKALITGVTGQDGAYLARLLLNKGYEVVGGYRRKPTLNTWRMRELGVDNTIRMVPFDVLEFDDILSVLQDVEPDEIYNLAGQSFVAESFRKPLFTSKVNAIGVIRLLEAIRIFNHKIRFYQASSSEMFGKVQQTPQTEATPFYPRSPYAVAKLYAHWMTVTYRESFGIHANSGILFNHESPLRDLNFVTRKITASMARIKYGQQDVLELGNLEAMRDWGFAGDYVEGMHAMLQQDKPDDFILATNATHSVRHFCEAAAHACDYDLVWTGEGIHAKGIDRKSGKILIQVNPLFYRPTEVDLVVGNPKKAKEKLGWAPKVDLPALVAMMTEADLRRASAGELE
ncbi:GDP-mannose 4,6-dehydratase [Rhodospirillum sp. A1_3_36]|uniref:GDP-mannose 4,6-dehydratase n=1 Tax=Rhodospirillum sp. A1_3_36 TaxID=3391666 RepID=UPI0039A6CEE5